MFKNFCKRDNFLKKISAAIGKFATAEPQGFFREITAERKTIVILSTPPFRSTEGAAEKEKALRIALNNLKTGILRLSFNQPPEIIDSSKPTLAIMQTDTSAASATPVTGAANQQFTATYFQKQKIEKPRQRKAAHRPRKLL